MLDLVVQTTQDPLAGFAVVVLNEVHIQARRLLKVLLVEALKKEAAVITKKPWAPESALQEDRLGSLCRA
jgi:hypothetical protein